MHASKKLIATVLAILIVGVLGSTALAGALYPVRTGDSLYKVARRFETTIDDLKKSNGLTGNTIYPGQALKVPGEGSNLYTVRKGDTPYLIAKRFGVKLADLQQKNDILGGYIEPGWVLVLSGSTRAAEKYLVKKGDTLLLIAQRLGTSVNTLRQLNGLQSDYIEAGWLIVIPTANTPAAQEVSTSSSDVDLLARLVQAEAAGEPYSGLVAVAATVLNRVKDSRYPNTIKGVVYQVVDGCYQYSPVLDGRIYLAAGKAAYDAVGDALKGWDPSFGANGFYNPAKTSNAWVRAHPVTTVIGNHVFFRY